MPRPRSVEFRVYAGRHVGSGLFVYARVFNTKREMLTTVRAENHMVGNYSILADNVNGVTQTFMRYASSGRLSPCMGRVNLHRGALGSEVVTHEFGHATFEWAHRKKLIGTLGELAVEELVCYALGRMVRRFVARAIALGLYED